MHPSLFHFVKASAELAAFCLVLPCTATCRLEKTLHPGAEGIFCFWTHVLALMPGHPGFYLRRAFYRRTLSSCGGRLTMQFGSFFSHREARVEEDVYIGSFAIVGRARLRSGCLIGSRASLLSGSAQHELGADGRWLPSNPANFREIEIGAYAWIGEAATVMADIGAGALVSAGAVVSAPVPAGIVVAGNPARFVRSLRPDPAAAAAADAKGSGREPIVHTRH